MKLGKRNSITDIAGFRVGNAHDEKVKTGTTVLTAEKPFVAAVDVRGGAPGTRETDLLAPDKLVEAVDALVLSGGSAFGLAAADGVSHALSAAGRGFDTGVKNVPIVPAAILFDLANGGDKDFAPHFYHDLGRAAYDKADIDFEIGRAGAGYGALTGCGQGGLGTASILLDSGHIVAALVAVNPLGAVRDEKGRFYAQPWEIGREFGGRDMAKAPLGLVSKKLDTLFGRTNPAGNTTIGIIATDAVLNKAEAQRLAVTAHDGFARAIYPAHTLLDGDLIFAAATSEKSLTDPIFDQIAFGHAAANAMARAVARAVYEAEDE